MVNSLPLPSPMLPGPFVKKYGAELHFPPSYKDEVRPSLPWNSRLADLAHSELLRALVLVVVRAQALDGVSSAERRAVETRWFCAVHA